MKYEYIGKKYIGETEEETLENKKKILSSYDDYQRNKLEFLNKCYKVESSMSAMWTLYNTQLHDEEVSRNKDLMYFEEEEYKNIISLLEVRDSTTSTLISFTKKYGKWAVGKGYINVNPYEKIKASEIKANSRSILKSKLYGQKMFYDLCTEMEGQTKLPNIMPLILARYGIMGEESYFMRHLKWDDIDRENYLVHLKKNDAIVTSLPIDSQFLLWIDKMKNYAQSPEYETSKRGETVKKGNVVRYEDYGYVLKKALSKKAAHDDGERVNKHNTVHNRCKEACKSIGISRIAFKDLVMTRQLELILQIRKHRRLEFKDFEVVIDKFNLDEKRIITNKAFILKKRYEDLTGDKVISRQNRDAISLGASGEGYPVMAAEEIIRDLGLDIEGDYIDVFKLSDELNKNLNDAKEDKLYEEGEAESIDQHGDGSEFISQSEYTGKIIGDFENEVDFIEHDEEKLLSDINELQEGDLILKLLEIKKRNRKARKLKLEDFKDKHNGRVYCEVCSEEDVNVLDVHHDSVQLSEMKVGHITKLSDLRVLCANCHRKVHYYKMTIDELLQA